MRCDHFLRENSNLAAVIHAIETAFPALQGFFYLFYNKN